GLPNRHQRQRRRDSQLQGQQRQLRRVLDRHLQDGLLPGQRRSQDRQHRPLGPPPPEPAGLQDGRPDRARGLRQLGGLGFVDRPQRRRLGHLLRAPQRRPGGQSEPDHVRGAQRQQHLG